MTGTNGAYRREDVLRMVNVNRKRHPGLEKIWGSFGRARLLTFRSSRLKTLKRLRALSRPEADSAGDPVVEAQTERHRRAAGAAAPHCRRTQNNRPRRRQQRWSRSAVELLLDFDEGTGEYTPFRLAPQVKRWPNSGFAQAGTGRASRGAPVDDAIAAYRR